MKTIDRKDGPIQPEACALYLYPEVFLKHRDDYMYSMIRKIAEEGHIFAHQPEDTPPIKTIDVYLGTLHVSPISRLWNTQTSLMGTKDHHLGSKVREAANNPDETDGEDGESRGRGRKLALKNKKEKSSLENQIIDFDLIH